MKMNEKTYYQRFTVTNVTHRRTNNQQLYFYHPKLSAGRTFILFSYTAKTVV